MKSLGWLDDASTTRGNILVPSVYQPLGENEIPGASR
jgi:hypothetical protein